MYAIVVVGAQQYVVKKGDVIEVEKLESEEGKDIKLDKVLLVSKEKKIEIGQPYVPGAWVVATVTGATKGAKVICYKYRRRKSKDWKVGHRQKYTELKIKEIEFS
ncbi:MAG: 50S ribosomal protein L21 [Candidatus Omnitrophota bacterium]